MEAGMKLDVSYVYIEEPSVVQGLLEFPDLASQLEYITNYAPNFIHAIDQTDTWYEDDYIFCRAGAVFIKDLALCSPHQIKLLRCHLPALAVVAYVPNPHSPAAAYALMSLEHILDTITLARFGPDGTCESEVYHPKKNVW